MASLNVKTAAVLVASATLSATAMPATPQATEIPELFNLRMKDAPADYQCLQVNAPPGGISMLWAPCKDKYARGPEAVFRMVHNGETVMIQEEHFNKLEPGVSPQCLLVTKNYRPNYDALVDLGDCNKKEANQQWKIKLDTSDNPQIISTYGKYSGKCLVQTQMTDYIEDDPDYIGELDFLPCGSSKTTDKKATVAPITQWQVIDATSAPFVSLFEIMKKDKLDKYEDPVPEGGFKLLVQGNPTSDRCMSYDANDGSTLGTAVCISRYADSPLALWKTVATKGGNVQFRELHQDNGCLTYLAKDLYDGDAQVAIAGVQVFECKPNALYQQWRFDEKAGLIKSADPKLKNLCVSLDPKSDYGSAFLMTSCDKASKFSKYTEYMHLDRYVDE